MKPTQTDANPKTDIIVRGVEAHEVGEAEQVLKEYQRAVSQIPEVQGAVYKQYGKNIEFIVAVDRMRREPSGQLSQIEGRCTISTPIGTLTLNILVFALFPNGLWTDTLICSVVNNNAGL